MSREETPNHPPDTAIPGEETVLAQEEEEATPPEAAAEQVDLSTTEPTNLTGGEQVVTMGEPITLNEDAPEGEQVGLSQTLPFTPEWAGIVLPVTRAILTMLAAVVLLPFGLVFLPEKELETAMDWAKTVLPPMVGFVGAVVGYYFGSRQT